MVKFVRFVLLVTFVLSLSSAVLATSTIDPTQPLQGQPYQSGPIRNNFQSAANDINALQTCNFGAQAPPAPQSGYCWVNTTAAPTWTYNFYDALTSKWVPVFNFDSVNSLLEPPVGGGLQGTVTAGATTDICSVPQAAVGITSASVTITSFGSTCPPGTIKFVTFSGGVTLQNNSNLLLPGNANITTAFEDTALVITGTTGSYKVAFYQTAATPPASGLAPLNSPNFTGIPTAPTAALGTNTTQIATTAFVANAVPIKLTAPLTLYVAATGTDSGNGCAVSSAPCLTIQNACIQAQNNYDLNAQQLTIQVANGTAYTAGCSINGLLRGQASVNGLTIQGNAFTPDSVALLCATACFTASGGAQFVVQNMKIAGSSNGLVASSSGVLEFSNLDFGGFSGNQIFDNGGYIIALGNYEISGGALAHIVVNYGQMYVVAGASITVSCVGSIGYTTAFVVAALSGSTVVYPGSQVTFSSCGSVTGTRYSVSFNSVIFTNGAGATFFPGNVSGSSSSGGQYN